MLTWIFLIVVLALLTVLFTWLFGRLFGRGEILPARDERQDVIGQNREHIAAGELEELSFDIVPRGYRADQVDAALADLKGQLSGGDRSGGSVSIEKDD